MTHSGHKRTNLLWLFAIVVLSAVTMLWLFWHHPVTTAIVTLVVLAAFAISARLANLVDSDISDLKLKQRNQA